MKLRKKQRLYTGYTLIEVMVAVMVLGIVGLGYYAGLASGFSLVQSTQNDLRATQIMTQKLETIRLCTWNELTNFDFQEAYDPLATTNPGPTFYGTVMVGSAIGITNNPSYYANMRQVTVRLTWTNYDGRTPIRQQREMQSQVARYGLQNYVWGAQ